MAGTTIFRSNLSSPALVLSSGGARSANALLKSSAGAVFATTAADGAVVSSNRNGASRMINSGGRRVLWVGARPSPGGDRVAAGGNPPQDPAAAAVARRPRPDAAPADPSPAPAAQAPPPEETAPPQPEALPPAAEIAETNEAPAAPAAEARPASKLELAINSLPGYELVKPIPVIVESLGNKVFVADVPDLDISITGTSVSGALLQLKDQIVRIYEGHRSKKNLDAERTRQLGKLESYIVKRRNWF